MLASPVTHTQTKSHKAHSRYISKETPPALIQMKNEGLTDKNMKKDKTESFLPALMRIPEASLTHHHSAACLPAPV